MNWWWLFFVISRFYIHQFCWERQKTNFNVYMNLSFRFGSPITRCEQCEQNFAPVIYAVVICVYRSCGQHTENNIFTFTCRRHIYYICFALLGAIKKTSSRKTKRALALHKHFILWNFCRAGKMIMLKEVYCCRFCFMCFRPGIQYNTIYEFRMRCTFSISIKHGSWSVRDRGSTEAHFFSFVIFTTEVLKVAVLTVY